MIICHMLLMIFNHACSRDEECVRSSVDEKGKGYFLSRFTQCGFLCNERPQCNFLLRNSKNPIFSSGSNFSSTSFPRRVKQVSASADGFWIIEIHDDHNDHDIDYDGPAMTMITMIIPMNMMTTITKIRVTQPDPTPAVARTNRILEEQEVSQDVRLSSVGTRNRICEVVKSQHTRFCRENHNICALCRENHNIRAFSCENHNMRDFSCENHNK